MQKETQISLEDLLKLKEGDRVRTFSDGVILITHPADPTDKTPVVLGQIAGNEKVTIFFDFELIAKIEDHEKQQQTQINS